MAIRSITGSPRGPQTPGLAERLIAYSKTIQNPAAAETMGKDMVAAARLLDAWCVGINEAIATTTDDATRLQKLLEG